MRRTGADEEDDDEEYDALHGEEEVVRHVGGQVVVAVGLDDLVLHRLEEQGEGLQDHQAGCEQARCTAPPPERCDQGVA